MGGGGYVAGPAGLAALSPRLPLVLTEADRHLGLANRLLAARARRVCLAFPIPGRDGERYVVTGRPVPAAILAADRDAARGASGSRPATRLPAGLRRQPGRALDQPRGARGLRRAPGRRPGLPRPPHRRPPRLRDGARAARGRRRRRRATRCSSTSPSLADALAACDLVLARAGGSMFELAAAGRPAILVPYPHAPATTSARTPSGWPKPAPPW